MNKLINILIALLLVIYPWGVYFDNFFSIPGFEGRGLSTLLAMFIIILGTLGNFFSKGLSRLLNGSLFLIFLLFALVGTVISGQIDRLFSNLVSLVSYFFIVAIIVGLNPTKKRVDGFIKTLLFSTSFMCLISLVDYLGIISIENFNQGNSVISVGNTWVKDLTGPHEIRTHLGVHISLIIFLPLIYFDLGKKSFFQKTCWLALFILLLSVTLLSHSRTIILALLAGFVYFIYYRRRAYFNLTNMILFLLLGVSLFNLISFGNNDFIASINSRLDFSNSSETSDKIRYYAFIATLKDIAVNPLGAGFSLPYIDEISSYKDVHNSLTFFLRAGGFIGFTALYFFFMPILKKIIFRRISNQDLVVFTPIICLGFFGLLHTCITVTTFWIILGFAFNSVYNDKFEKYIYQENDFSINNTV